MKMLLSIKLFIFAMLCLTLWIIFIKIHRNKTKIKDTLTWVFLIICLMPLAFWPEPFYFVAKLIGFNTTSLVLLLIIVILFWIVFTLWMKASIINDKIKFLIQVNAINEKRIRELENEINNKDKSK